MTPPPGIPGKTPLPSGICKIKPVRNKVAPPQRRILPCEDAVAFHVCIIYRPADSVKRADCTIFSRNAQVLPHRGAKYGARVFRKRPVLFRQLRIRDFSVLFDEEPVFFGRKRDGKGPALNTSDFSVLRKMDPLLFFSLSRPGRSGSIKNAGGFFWFLFQRLFRRDEQSRSVFARKAACPPMRCHFGVSAIRITGRTPRR